MMKLLSHSPTLGLDRGNANFFENLPFVDTAAAYPPFPDIQEHFDGHPSSAMQGLDHDFEEMLQQSWASPKGW